MKHTLTITGSFTVNAAQLAKELEAIGIKSDPADMTVGPAEIVLLYEVPDPPEPDVDYAQLIRDAVEAHSPQKKETDPERLVRLAGELVNAKDPYALAMLVLANMLERAVAENRVRSNELSKRMDASGIKTGDLPDLLVYPTFEAAIEAWKAAMAGRAEAPPTTVKRSTKASKGKGK